MGWHLSWQDPVALALVVLLVFATRWLRKKLAPVGCGNCPHVTNEAAPPRPVAPTRVPLERLRLGRSRR